MKKCYSCNIIKDLSCFGKHSRNKDGIRHNCKDCRKVESKNRREQIKDKNKVYFKEYYLANKEKLKKYHKTWRDKNITHVRENAKKVRSKESYRISRNNYITNRSKNDSLFRFRTGIRNRLKMFFKKSKQLKPCKTEQLIGGSFDIAKKHIESLFKDGMSWDNYGKWHIDHIKPLCLAKSESEIAELCHYTNLQPLWAKDNLLKGKIY